jgi:hypothetical protein
MSPAASPAGAERAPAARRPGVVFSRTTAAEIAGLGELDLRRWEQALRVEAGLDLGEQLPFCDLLALVVVKAAADQLRFRASDYVLGLAETFRVLRNRTDEPLDQSAILVGRDFARLTQLRGDHVRCSAGDFIVIDLGAILADLRDRVFA